MLSLRIHSGNSSNEMQRLNNALSLCFIFVFSIAAISIAFAVQQIFLVEEKQLAVTNLQRQIYNLKQDMTELEHKFFTSEKRKRFLIFKKHLDRTSNVLTDQDLKALAEKTDGYSEGDIAIIVRGASIQRVRMLQTATHFKKVRGPSPIDSTQIVDDLLIPCSPSDAGAFKMAQKDVPKDKLFEPPVTMSDVLQSLASTQPNDGDGDVKM